MANLVAMTDSGTVGVVPLPDPQERRDLTGVDGRDYRFLEPEDAALRLKDRILALEQEHFGLKRGYFSTDTSFLHEEDETPEQAHARVLADRLSAVEAELSRLYDELDEAEERVD